MHYRLHFSRGRRTSSVSAPTTRSGFKSLFNDFFQNANRKRNHIFTYCGKQSIGSGIIAAVITEHA